MPTKQLLDAQHYLDKKTEWVLNTFLGGVIDDFNSDYGYTGDKALRKPKEFYVNADGLSLAAISSNPYDLKNTIITRILNSTTNDDNLINDRDIKPVLEVIAIYVTDYGKLDWATKQSRYLAIAAEQVLEAYLPDQAQDSDGCVIYNTRLASSTGASVIPLQNQDFYLVATSVQLEVSMRANIQYSPTLISPNLPLLPWVASSYKQPPIDLTTDLAVVIGTAQPQSTTDLTITAANLGAATDIVITQASIPDGSVAYLSNQMTGNTATGTFAAGSASIPLASLPVNDSDIWTLTIVNTDTNTPCAYALTWDVV